jgi:hypothetical protein
MARTIVGGGGTLLQENPVFQLFPGLLTIPPPPQFWLLSKPPALCQPSGPTIVEMKMLLVECVE